MKGLIKQAEKEKENKNYINNTQQNINKYIANKERFMLFILGLIIGSLIIMLALTLINISRWF